MEETVHASNPNNLTNTLLMDRYLVGEKLGEGGMATVYLATDQNFSETRTVVIKVPHIRLLVDPEFVRRFEIETRALVELEEDARVLPIIDRGEHVAAGVTIPFTVVKYLRGGDLKQRAEKERAQPGRPTLEALKSVEKWLTPVAEVLDFVHAKQVIHRDIKPANILFDTAGNVFLSDFGIAKAVKNVDATQGAVEELTAADGFVGTPSYAPPEAQQRVPTGTYDQYSLGVTVYQVISGKLPVKPRDNPWATLDAKAKEPPIPLRKVAPEMPRAVERSVMRALDRSPELRFENCAAFARAFSDAVKNFEETPPRPRWRSVPLLLGALAIVGLIVAFPFLEDTFRGLEDTIPGSIGGEPKPVARVPFRSGSTPEEIELAISLCQGSMPKPLWAEECGGAALYRDEAPQNRMLVPVQLDRTEVTNAAFEAFVDQQPNGYETEAERTGSSFILGGADERRGLSWRRPSPDSDLDPDPDLPVVHVSFGDATRYCESLGRRLPSAEEWEYAARGAERRIFPWGNQWNREHADWGALGTAPAPVGSHPASATTDGIQDLAGSVWEWTTTRDGEGGRFLKGGSWSTANPAHLRSAANLSALETYRSDDIGFRCVSDPSGSRATQ